MKQIIKQRFDMLMTILLLLALAGMMPFIQWIGIRNPNEIYASLGVKREVASYLSLNLNLYNLLDFIKLTKFGSVGLPAMLLLLLLMTSIIFIFKSIYGLYFKKPVSDLSVNQHKVAIITTIQITGFFITLTSLITYGFVIWANVKTGTTSFYGHWSVLAIMIIGLAIFIISKSVGEELRKQFYMTGFIHELKKNWVLFLMLIPTFVYFMINNYLPMIGVYYAFTSFNFRDGLWASPFIGLKNFEYLMVSDLFKLTKNTVLYNLVFIGVGNMLQVVFAILVSQLTLKRVKKLSQTFMLMPYFVSFVILRVLVYNLFEYDSGMINTMLLELGGGKIDFYNSPEYWPFLITIFYMWKSIGYGMVVYLAAITGISPEYYEAAKVDGATLVQQIRHITLPLIKPTFIILLLYALGSIMKGQFELFYQMVGNNGVLYNATDIFDTYVYRITTTQPLSIGIGTAAGLYQSIFGFVIIVITNYLVKRKNPDYALF